jgi:hypothetical protein
MQVIVLSGIIPPHFMAPVVFNGIGVDAPGTHSSFSALSE